MNIDDRTIWMMVIMVILFMIIVYCLFFIQKMYHKLEVAKTGPGPIDSKQIQLAAYERLTIFAERNKISNLITKLFQSTFNAREMQQVLTNNIREEFEHNLSQQLYVKPEIWDAIQKLKDQNIYIINQVASSMPANATALDLNKQLLELINTNPNVTMNKVVLDALQFETKQLL